MHRDEFRFAPPAQIMNRVRRQFFAGPALTLDQNVGRRRRDLAHGVEHFAQRGRISDDVFQAKTLVHLLLQHPIFLLEFSAAERSRDQHFHLVEIQRLGHEIIRATLHCLHRRIHGTVGRHHDANRRMRPLQRALDQLHSVIARQPQISDQDIDVIALDHIHRARQISRDVGVVFVLQQLPQPIPGMLFVVNNEDRRLHGSRGHSGAIARCLNAFRAAAPAPHANG